MKIPRIKGIIDRRILINYQIDEQVLAHYLPKPFRPQLVNGKGIAGICLIRLKGIRPKGLPQQIGISSENGAHRIAVEWLEGNELKEGVYIPRRDTSSKINAWAGGAVFPGIHHLAHFTVKEEGNAYEVGFTSEDGTALAIKATETTVWNPKSVFKNLDEVSAFFENGSVGYSPCKGGFVGLQLKSYRWQVSLLEVENVASSFFDNEKVFPKGSVKFDNALLMKNIEHEWIGLSKLK